MSAISDALAKTALVALGARLPEFNPDYVYELQWLFDDENCSPHIASMATAMSAMERLIALWNSGRVLVHISISRRNA